MDETIETIQEHGLYKAPKRNFLSTVHDEALAAWILGIGGALFTLGLLIGGAGKGDKDDHRREVALLKDSITILHNQIARQAIDTLPRTAVIQDTSR